MSPRRVSESDVVDVLLGQATRELEEHVRSERKAGAPAASTYEFWSTVLAAVEAERQEARTIARDALDATLDRLEHRVGESSAVLDLRQGPSNRFFPGNSSYGFGRYARAALVAGCVMLTGFSSFFYLRANEGLDFLSSSGLGGLRSASQGMQAGDELVAFLLPGSADNMRGRVEMLRSNNFSEILFYADSGATIMLQTDSASVLEQETTRIDKPIRLEVTNAPVRIARFDQ